MSLIYYYRFDGGPLSIEVRSRESSCRRPSIYNKIASWRSYSIRKDFALLDTFKNMKDEHCHYTHKSRKHNQRFKANNSEDG